MTAPHIVDGSEGAAPYAGDASFFNSIGADEPKASEPSAPSADPEPEPVAGAEPSAPAPVPDVPDASRQRDGKGRFAPKAPDAPPAPVPAPAEAVAPAPTAQAPEPPPAPAEPAPVRDLSAFPPLEYRSGDGRTISIPGSHVGEDGVLIRKDAVPQLLRRFADADAAHARSSNQGRELAEAKRQIEVQGQKHNAIMARISDIMADPEKFEAWAADTQANWKTLLLETELQMEREERQRLSTAGQRESSEREMQQFIPKAHGKITETVGQIIGGPDYKDLGFDAAWQQEFLATAKQQFLGCFEATQADVQAGRARQVGEVLFDPARIKAEIDRIASPVRAFAERTKALSAAAARNAATQPAAPPVAGVKPTTAPASKAKPALKAGMSAQEVNRHVFDAID